MKEYTKPYIEEEKIEIEDIVAASGDPLEIYSDPMDINNPTDTETM